MHFKTTRFLFNNPIQKIGTPTLFETIKAWKQLVFTKYKGKLGTNIQMERIIATRHFKSYGRSQSRCGERNDWMSI